MQALVGKAQEEDDAFYNGLFGEALDDESDKDFNSQDESVESGKDSFDSDFNQSSGDEQEKGNKAAAIDAGD